MTYFLPLLAVGFIVGLAVGATGIGGILLVPFLTFALGLGVQRAISATLVSYLPSSLLAVWLYDRRGSVKWRMALPLSLAALPAASLGALAAGWAPAGLLEALIGLLMLSGGVNGLWLRQEKQGSAKPLGVSGLAGLGAVTGFLSAMTGAGGALVLMPLLLMLEQPVLVAIGLGQTIALPIAAVASLTNLRAGYVDLDIAVALAVSLGAGIALGTPIAHRLPQAQLKRFLSIMIGVLGLLMLARLAWRLSS